MFCQSFPPHRARTDRERKQFWLTLFSILLLISGFVLLIVWLSFFLQGVMRVQNGANQYNDAVSNYDPSPIAGWLPGVIGEAQATLATIPVIILGETYSVDSATSTVLTTTLTATTSNVTTVPPFPPQVYYSLIDVALFDRSPRYVREVEKPAACPRTDGCSNETMEVYCRTNYGPLAQYRGAGCPKPVANGDTPLLTSCGHCAFNLTLRTYCVVVGPTDPNNGSIPEVQYTVDSAFQSCYYPFSDANADQDFFLNYSARSYAEQIPTSVTFVIRKSDDPFIVAQQLTQGTMILQNQSLKYYLYFIIPTAVLLVTGIAVFFIGIKVGQRKDSLGQHGSGGKGVRSSSGGDPLTSSRFKVVSGRLAVAVVVNAQNGHSVPLLIDTKDYNAVAANIANTTSTGNFSSIQNQHYNNYAGNHSSTSSSKPRSRNTSPATTSNSFNKKGTASRRHSQDSVAILTASGEDGTVSTTIVNVDAEANNYGVEPVGYGDEPTILPTTTKKATKQRGGRGGGSPAHCNPPSVSASSATVAPHNSAIHVGGERHSGYGSASSTSRSPSASPKPQSSSSTSRGNSLRRFFGGEKKPPTAPSNSAPPTPLQQPVSYGDPDGVGYGDLDNYP